MSLGSTALNLFRSRRRGRTRAGDRRRRVDSALKLNSLTMEGRLEPRVLLASAASLNQWANVSPANWVNGNLNPGKPTLFEADSVPYQDLFTGLNTASGNVYSFGIQWQTTNSGLHAQDYVTSDDFTWTIGSMSGVSVTSTNPATNLSHELDGVDTSGWTAA